MSVRQSSGPKTIAELKALQEKTLEVRRELAVAVQKDAALESERVKDAFVPYSELPVREQAVFASIEVTPSHGVIVSDVDDLGGVQPYGIALAVVLVGFIFLIKRL